MEQQRSKKTLNVKRFDCNHFLFRFMMTEAYASLENQVRWYGTEEKRGAHMPFNFALISDLDVNSRAQDFKTAIDSWLGLMPSFGEANWVLGNHDRSRIGFRYGEDRHESLAIMTMLLPGINVVYYVRKLPLTSMMNLKKFLSRAKKY